MAPNKVYSFDHVYRALHNLVLACLSRLTVCSAPLVLHSPALLTLKSRLYCAPFQPWISHVPSPPRQSRFSSLFVKWVLLAISVSLKQNLLGEALLDSANWPLVSFLILPNRTVFLCAGTLHNTKRLTGLSCECTICFTRAGNKSVFCIKKVPEPGTWHSDVMCGFQRRSVK